MLLQSSLVAPDSVGDQLTINLPRSCDIYFSVLVQIHKLKFSVFLCR